MSNGNGWRAEQHGDHYLITNGPRYLLNGHANDHGTPHEFDPADTAAWQWALARLNGMPVSQSSVDGDRCVWIIDTVTVGRDTADDYMTCVGRIEETEGGWEALAPGGARLHHWRQWNADGATGYPKQADAARAVVKFHELASQSKVIARVTGSVDGSIEEGPWRVEWTRATDTFRLVVEGK